MTHEEKWKRIREIGQRLKEIAAEMYELQKEENTLLLAHTEPPKSGDVLIKSPLGTVQEACGNRSVTNNPTTIRVQ